MSRVLEKRVRYRQRLISHPAWVKILATMLKPLTRRDFLKVSGLALTSLAFQTPWPPILEHDQGLLARVTVNEIDLRSAARDDAPIIGKRYKDQLVHIYYDLIPPDAPKFYNPLWYRVWGGYLHSKWLQIVQVRYNDALSTVPESGVLCEVTVPYSQAYRFSSSNGWQPWRGSNLYYGSTHWITAVEEGPDKEPWYRITSELSASEIYYIPAAHLRPFTPEELAPIAADTPPEQKRIAVSISQQRVWAYENNQEVFTARVSTGIPSRQLSEDSLPTATPRGVFRIYSKMPSKHMGSIAYGPDIDANGGFSLPGVPWTSFFKFPGGYAFHGTYWHNNFGLQMSHGCINMRNEDALWLFRWSTPVFAEEIEDHSDWEKRGNGTLVEID